MVPDGTMVPDERAGPCDERTRPVGGSDGAPERGDPDAEVLRSRDEDAVGWGDERAYSSGDGTAEDPDVARLLADRPPHHDRD
jgi:hypothetical protein